MIPTTMKAMVTTGDGNCTLQDIAVPVPTSTEVLVQVYAAAQNPTDWKSVGKNREAGFIPGCDFSGIVAALGPDVDPETRKKGDKVAGFVHGTIRANGAFSQYLVVPSELVFSIPDSMPFEEAAQLGVACFTSCQALYQTLNLPTPFNPSSGDILIWSGTSSTGQILVQLAKLSGLRVISTASSTRLGFVKSLGADEVFDYADPRTPEKIRKAYPNLKYAVDCISEGDTPKQVTSSLAEGGIAAILLPYESPTPNVVAKFFIAYTIFGKAFGLYPAYPEHHQNAIVYTKLISDLLAQNKIKAMPIKLYEGLEKVPEGLEYMKAGKVHAEKIIYRVHGL